MQVRFFHDSVQSFLTAQARIQPDVLSADVLSRAASDPRFGEPSASGFTELFAMIVDSGSDAAGQAMLQFLAESATLDFRISEVASALTPRLQAAIRGRLPVGLKDAELGTIDAVSARQLLRWALEACRVPEATLEDIARLFAGVARASAVVAREATGEPQVEQPK